MPPRIAAARAQKIGFDAYGTTQDLPDPMARAVDQLLDHIHAMDRRVEVMCQAMKKAGVEFEDLPLPALDEDEIRGSCGGTSELPLSK